MKARTRSFFAQLRRLFRPPRTLKVTRTGRTYLVLTIGVGLGALNTGNNLLYLVLGLLLSLIIVSGVLSERSLRGLSVQRLGTEGAFAGEPFAFRWTVGRERGLAFALTFSELDAGLEGEAALALLEPGRPEVVRAELVAPRRGKYPLTAVRVTTTFPLGLFAKSRLFDVEDTLWVYPARRSAAGGPPDTEATASLDSGSPRRGEGAGEIFGLTELREGDDARRIHWLKSAAGGALLRTQREREERRSVVLRVEPQGPLEQLDRRCEDAAASATALLDQGFEVGLEVGQTRLRPASGPLQARRILLALAAAGFEDA